VLEPVSSDLRAEARAFLREHLTEEIVERAHRTGTMHDWTFHRALAAEGWLTAGWPVEWGGRGFGPSEMFDVIEEMVRAGAPIDGWTNCGTVAATLRAFGNPDVNDEVLPLFRSGEAIVCLGFTEPESGSDVGAATTKAVPDGGGWLINGQKMFTTLAHEASWVLLLTRTSTDGPKHGRLTLFLVPMHTPGIEVRAVHTLGGERTNITFYMDVKVHDRWRIGEVGGGWAVLMGALNNERGGEMGGSAHYSGNIARLVDRACRGIPRPFSDRAAVELGRAWAQLEAGRLLGRHAAWIAGNGGTPAVEAAMAKLYTSEAVQAAAGRLLDQLGPAGVLQAGTPGAPADGALEYEYRHTAVATIYGGTSEIMRTIIALQGLGLPRPDSGQ
jgi:alkylation response protein AidB-like acyl-CoA dehydrogenase